VEIRVEQLRNILDIVKPTVPRKTKLPILKNALVKDGKLMATDLESMVIIDVPEVDEAFLLPYAEVLKMLKYVPGYEKLQVHPKNGNLELSWSEGEATYPMDKVKNFPVIPDFEVKDEADIDGDIFIPALASALPYAATESTRPVLNGVTVQFGGPIEIGAGDGYRMANIVLPAQFPTEYTAILPSAAVTTLVHVMAKTPRTPPQGQVLTDIILAKRQIRVALDGKKGLRVAFAPNVSVIVKLIEGSPPAWFKLAPKDEPILKVQFFARDLETAVRRVSDVAHQNKGIVRLQFQDGTGKVSARTDDREVAAKIPLMDMQGEPNRLALNVGYLTEYLKDKEGIVTMSWTGGKTPASFHHSKGPKVLIMPMQANWDEKKSSDKAELEAVAEAPAETTAEAPAGAAPEAKTSKPKRQRAKKAKK